MIESLPLESGSLLKRREDGSFAAFACRAAVLESASLGGSGGEESETVCFVVSAELPEPGDRLETRNHRFDLAKVRVFRNFDGRVVACRCTPVGGRG